MDIDSTPPPKRKTRPTRSHSERHTHAYLAHYSHITLYSAIGMCVQMISKVLQIRGGQAA